MRREATEKREPTEKGTANTQEEQRQRLPDSSSLLTFLDPKLPRIDPIEFATNQTTMES